MGTAVGGTHPNGMHSCLHFIFTIYGKIYSSLPDYDVVCFLNDAMPDIQILKHFKGVIRQKFGLKRKEVRICIHSLQFALQGVEFDLLFAKNMVTRNSSGSKFTFLFVPILIF